MTKFIQKNKKKLQKKEVSFYKKNKLNAQNCKKL